MSVAVVLFDNEHGRTCDGTGRLPVETREHCGQVMGECRVCAGGWPLTEDGRVERHLSYLARWAA